MKGAGKILKYTFILFLSLALAILLVKASLKLPPAFGANFIPSLLLLVFLIASGTLLARRSLESERELGLLSLFFGFLWALSLLWTFREVPFALGGGNWDSWYSHAMAAHFKHFWGNSDFNYQGLSNFYPFLYQYIVGKAAWALSIPPYTALKHSVMIAAAFLPFLIYASWKKLAEPSTAFLISALSIFSTYHFLLYKPYEALTLVFIFPWWWIHIEEGSKSFKKVLMGGFLGGLIFATYYLWFFPLLLLIVAELIYSAANLKALRPWWREWRGRLEVLLFTALFSSFFWLPYALDLITKGGISLQNKWFKAKHLIPFVPLSSFSLEGVLSLLGLLFVVYASKHSIFARRTGKLILTLYSIILISDLLVLVKNPLPNFRLNQMLLFVYMLGFAFAWKEAGSFELRLRQRSSLAFSLVLFSLVLLRLPEVRNEKLFHLSSASSVLNLEQRKDLRAIYGKTVLNLPPRVLIFIPAKKFIAHNPFYSHPSAHLGKRLAFLYLLQFSQRPSFFFFALRNNNFSSVEYIYLKNNFLQIKALYENFLHRKMFSEYKFKYEFISRQKLRPLFRNVVKEGDFIAEVPHPRLDLTALSPLEEFVAAKFISQRFKQPKPIASFGWFDVFHLGKCLLFYKEDCPRERWRRTKIVVKTDNFQEEVSLKDGLLTTTCALAVSLPSPERPKILLKN